MSEKYTCLHVNRISLNVAPSAKVAAAGVEWELRGQGIQEGSDIDFDVPWEFCVMHVLSFPPN